MRDAGSPSKDSISDKHKIENTKTGIQSSKPDSCFLLSHLTKTTLRFNFLKLRFNFFFLCFNFPKLEFVHTETKSHKTKTSVRKCKSRSNARFSLYYKINPYSSPHILTVLSNEPLIIFVP